MLDFLCPHCNKANRPGAKFCKHCRTALRWLGKRYVVGALLEQQGNVAVHEALDLWLCRACGSLVKTVTAAACPECETTPILPLPCRVEKHAASPAPTQVNGDGRTETWLYDEGENVWYTVLQPDWQVDLFPEGQRLVAGCASDPGQRTTSNEDSLLVHIVKRIYESKLNTVGILAVADGMGGHNAGEVASREAIENLLSFLAGKPIPEEVQALQNLLVEAVEMANNKIFEIHRQQNLNLGTTLTAAIVVKGAAVVANVGDSRTYLFRAGELQQITQDHSKVGLLVRKKQLHPDEIYTHPDKSVIYRCLGDDPQLEIDTFMVQLEPNDRLLLCGDGLWEMVRDKGITQVLQEVSNPQTACDELVKQANIAGGEDNISLIVADILAIEIRD